MCIEREREKCRCMHPARGYRADQGGQAVRGSGAFARPPPGAARS